MCKVWGECTYNNWRKNECGKEISGQDLVGEKWACTQHNRISRRHVRTNKTELCGIPRLCQVMSEPFISCECSHSQSAYRIILIIRERERDKSLSPSNEWMHYTYLCCLTIWPRDPIDVSLSSFWIQSHSPSTAIDATPTTSIIHHSGLAGKPLPLVRVSSRCTQKTVTAWSRHFFALSTTKSSTTLPAQKAMRKLSVVSTPTCVCTLESYHTHAHTNHHRTRESIKNKSVQRHGTS